VSPARLAVVIWFALLAQWSVQWSERKKVAQVYTRTALSAILHDQFKSIDSPAARKVIDFTLYFCNFVI